MDSFPSILDTGYGATRVVPTISIFTAAVIESFIIDIEATSYTN